jgi:hypothetical protein
MAIVKAPLKPNAAAERDELERKAAELDRQGQRLRDGAQKRQLLLEARSLRDQAKQRARKARESKGEAPSRHK